MRVAGSEGEGLVSAAVRGGLGRGGVRLWFGSNNYSSYIGGI